MSETEIKRKLNEMRNREAHFEFRIITDIVKKHSPEDLDVVLNLIKKYDVLARKCISVENQLNNKKYREDQSKWGIHEKNSQR